MAARELDSRVRLWPFALGLAGCGLLLLGAERARGEPEAARALWLAHLLTFASFSAAFVLFSAIGRLTGARFAAPLRPLAESASVAALVTMLIEPPVDPRPPVTDVGPFATSTDSTLNVSRVTSPGSRAPSM